MRRSLLVPSRLNPVSSRLLLGAVVFAALSGCGGDDYVDTDATVQTAMGLPTDLGVEGDLDFDKGDLVDWKQMTAREDGKATITVRIGDVFAGTHNMRGRIAVFDRDANQFASASVEPNVVKYVLSWAVEKDTAYLIRLQADSGKAQYGITLSVDVEEQDPCENVECDDGEECEDGECVGGGGGSGECNPACRSGYSCEDGECVEDDTEACGGKCKKGEYCNKKKDRCYKDPCYGKNCPSNHYCSGGKCKAKATTPAKKGPCDPECDKSMGEKCTKGKCVLGPISARIVQSIPKGQKTELTLNRGATLKVKKGQTGTVSGVGSFKIVEVYAVRCKAILNAPSSKLGDKKSATIYRK